MCLLRPGDAPRTNRAPPRVAVDATTPLGQSFDMASRHLKHRGGAFRDMLAAGASAQISQPACRRYFLNGVGSPALQRAQANSITEELKP